MPQLRPFRYFPENDSGSEDLRSAVTCNNL
jgi:hypothetical protein